MVLAQSFVVALAHEALNVSAEEPDVPAKLDPPQDAGASSVQNGGDRHRKEGRDLSSLHNVFTREPARGGVGERPRSCP